VQAELNLSLPRGVDIHACRLRAGDDASCLNLYQPLRPRVLGVPASVIDRGGFAFSATQGETSREKDNPWRLLEKPVGRDEPVPAFADANTAEWILKVGLGDVITVPGDRGEPVKLKIVGLFSESIFQSELLVAESNFKRLFPRQQGFSFFLIDCP